MTGDTMMATREISNGDDVIDSRDIIARIEELEAEREAYRFLDDGLTWKETEEAAELDTLRELAEEASDSPDWTYGETLIRSDYFKEYAQQLAEDCGMLSEASEQWPLRCIDWKQAARELKMDYFSVDYDGVEYFIRS